MICLTCRTAADAHAPRDQHCTDPKCMCGHRVERYRPLPTLTVDDRTPPLVISSELLDQADPPIDLGMYLGRGWAALASVHDATPHTDATED